MKQGENMTGIGNMKGEWQLGNWSGEQKVRGGERTYEFMRKRTKE